MSGLTDVLDPHDRELLLDALRPDVGSVLERAVGTSFSVDLEALLLAPLAFALFETDGGPPDPTALLAAIQQHGANIALYCDAAHIKAPASQQKLFVLLEPSLLPVHAPKGGAFHPKLWFLRYRFGDGSKHHRLLVLSRNLTFDTCWDLLVRFDEDETGASLGAGAARLLAGLDALAPSAISRSLARSIAKSRFAVPAPFDGARLHGLGFDTTSTDPIAVSPGDRALVVSPFLTAGRLAELEPLGTRKRTLVSRPDELERIGGAAIERWGTPLILRETEVGSPEAENRATLRGLHAKLFVVDRGGRATWYAGSANATTSSLRRNVEVVVELEGPRSKVGVGVLLSEAGKEVRFRTLLEEFPLLDADPAPKTPQDEEEDRLDGLVRELCRLDFDANVTADGAAFRVELELRGERPALAASDQLHARLVTRSLGETVDLHGSPAARLAAARASEITALIAMRLTGDASLARPREFVIAARLHNEPEDRIERLLVDLIPDRRRFALLLFLMLAAGDPETEVASGVRQLLTSGDADAAPDQILDIPLFESLVRTSARDPQRLGAIDRLVSQIVRTEEGLALLPEGFQELWTSFEPLIEQVRP